MKSKRRSDDHPLGQLCPYQDCCHDLAFSEEGWYECPACHRAFYAEVSDSDYEDFKCYREDGKKRIAPAELMTAEDLGSFWATPEEKDSRRMSKLQRLIAKFLHQQEREIKDVETWKGDPAEYADTAAFCQACLLNLNTGDPVDWTQENCKLPVREDGDAAGVYVRQAVYAAVGGHGISQVEKPADVTDEAWNAALKKAAVELLAVYGEMEEQAPDAVYELAGETPPEARTKAIGDVYSNVYEAILEADETAWITDIYFDGPQMFAVIASEGKLFRADVNVGENEAVTIGNLQEVKIDFPAVQGESEPTSFQVEELTSFDGEMIEEMRQTIKPFTVVRQQADGRYRWISISCSAVLNRMGEIDSRQLFDSFIAHAEESHKYPIRQFYHAGGKFRTGQADFLGRDDALLIASGLYDDTEIARMEIAARMKDPDYWGDSIGFDPTAAPSMFGTGSITIPVYESGIIREISTLPEDEACAWMTATPEIKEERMLSERQLKAFIKLFDGDEDAARKWLDEHAATRNREIAEKGMITRQAAEPAIEAAPVPEVTEVPAQPELVEHQFVLDETAMSELVNRVVAVLPKPEIPGEIVRGIEGITQAIAGLSAELAEVKTRLGKFEGLAQEMAEIDADVPPVQPARSLPNVTYRPRQNAPEAGEKVSAAVLAEEILRSKKPIK